MYDAEPREWPTLAKDVLTLAAMPPTAASIDVTICAAPFATSATVC
jgi:hypothetical protein